jgi:phenylacetate-CoA ligase
VPNEFLDHLETREPETRERSQFGLLPDLVRKAIAGAPGWADHLDGVDPSTLTSRAALAKVPLMRKASLHGLQRQWLESAELGEPRNRGTETSPTVAAPTATRPADA